MVTSQQGLKGSLPTKLADDCHDPALFRTLLGCDDVFPNQHQAVG